MHGRQEGRIPLCTPYQFYRVLLSQVEYRALCVRSDQINISESFNPDFFYRPRMDQEFRDVAKSIALTFAPLANTISAMGNININNHTYYPQIPLVIIIIINFLKYIVMLDLQQVSYNE